MVGKNLPRQTRKPLLWFLSLSFLSAGIQLTMIAPAKADCKYESKTDYKTGDIRGPYICMPDGTWQQR